MAEADADCGGWLSKYKAWYMEKVQNTTKSQRVKDRTEQVVISIIRFSSLGNLVIIENRSPSKINIDISGHISGGKTIHLDATSALWPPWPVCLHSLNTVAFQDKALMY